MRYWVLGRHPWNKRIFDDTISKLPGEWKYVSSPEELTLEAVKEDNPDKLFLVHWSWKVPDEIVNNYECIAFHPTRLPFGRGGSPVQNLIVRGYDYTTLVAFRMTPELDAGPIYRREGINLDGSAEQIYIRISEMIAVMIEDILFYQPEPENQIGDPIVFRRRTPEMSRMLMDGTIGEAFDYIRMLDAEGYPRAYLDVGTYHYELDHAVMYDDRVEAHVTITRVKE